MESNTSINSTLDRFIPLRGSSYASFKLSHKHPRPASISCLDYLRKFDKHCDETNFMQYNYKKNIYKDLLVQTLFQSPQRVLNFSPEQKARTTSNVQFESDWPVRPRKKPLITTPRIDWDLSDFDLIGDGLWQKLDWGPGDHLAGFLPDTVYLFNIEGATRELCFKNMKNGRCLKWINEYQLAMSFKRGGLDIGDIRKNKIIVSHPMTSDTHKIKVNYIAYSDHFVVTCHKNALIQVWDHHLTLISSVKNSHKGRILTAKISRNENYLATNGSEGSINIWRLPECKKMSEIKIRSQLMTAIDWHPWKSSMLALGKSTNEGFCTILDINKPCEKIPHSNQDNVLVDCLSFNPNSAELAVGYSIEKPTHGRETSIRHNIVVQSNLNTIVDDINIHKGRIMYMLWDKEGRRLATVDSEEDLAVCNFFSQEEKKKKEVKEISGMFRQGLIR